MDSERERRGVQLQPKSKLKCCWEATIYPTSVPILRAIGSLEELLPEHMWRSRSAQYRDGLWQTQEVCHLDPSSREYLLPRCKESNCLAATSC